MSKLPSGVSVPSGEELRDHQPHTSMYYHYMSALDCEHGDTVSLTRQLFIYVVHGTAGEWDSIRLTSEVRIL